MEQNHRSVESKWFSRFRDKNDNVNACKEPTNLDKDNFNALLHDPPHLFRELANTRDCDQSPIIRQLHSIDKVQVLVKWVLYELGNVHKNQCVNICASLLPYKHSTFLVTRYLWLKKKNVSQF